MYAQKGKNTHFGKIGHDQLLHTGYFLVSDDHTMLIYALQDKNTHFQ
jgi:hypothetical protein